MSPRRQWDCNDIVVGFVVFKACEKYLLLPVVYFSDPIGVFIL